MSPPPSSEGPVDHAARVLADRYRLERRIGQGGMAEVWVAVDEQLDRRVAVKWLKPNLASDEVVAERFRREAIAVARLNHPNIVTVHDVFEHDGRQAVVMQLIEGQSLRQVLDNRKRLGPELTIHIGASVAGALDEAHRAGFVHRDVKPGNILFTQDGRVLLTDFGIAKALDTIDEDLTSDNVMMGTAKYLAPEQVRGTNSTAAPTSTHSAWCSTSASPVGCLSSEITTPRPRSLDSSAIRPTSHIFVRPFHSDSST